VNFNCTVREYAPGSSMVNSLMSVPKFGREKRSMVWSFSVCGVPRLSNQNLSL